MKRTCSAFFLLLSFFTISSSQSFNCNVNLVTNDDQIRVDIKLPPLKLDKAVFYLPKVIPGTYSVSDFGRFITSINFFNKNGEPMDVKEIDNNSYEIENAQKLDSLSYWIEDTWGSRYRKNKIFYPNGSSFDKNHVFVLNSGAYLGCIKGYEEYPYHVIYEKPDNLFVTTTLKTEKTNQASLYASNYHELIDSPVMICEADTASFYVKDNKITVSSFSETGEKMTAKILPDVENCMQSVLNFWGYLPVDHYTFMFYFMDLREKYNDLLMNPGLFKLLRHFRKVESGALEHKHSSFYVLLDMGANIKSPIFKDINYDGFLKEVVIHEYMHTITPIGLHSEEIGEINYYQPSVSKHLWLYEGVTEYFSNLIMLQNNMVSLEDFFNGAMKKNVLNATKYPFNKISMIEMSDNVLDKKYNKHYEYVYTYGALLGLMIDIEIIRLSDGKKCLKDIVKTLYEKYGYEKSFDDEEFLNEFFGLAPLGLEDFFTNYVIGSKKPDYNEYLKHIGVRYAEKENLNMPSVLNSENGIYSFNINRVQLAINGNLEIGQTSDKSQLKPGDVINVFQMEGLLYHGITPLVKEKDTIILDVVRKNNILKIPFVVHFTENEYNDVFIIQDNPDEKQTLYLNKWLGNTDRITQEPR